MIRTGITTRIWVSDVHFWYLSQVSLLPGYNSEVGAAWLEKGFAYAVANIRGGGEFGPDWHQVSGGLGRGVHDDRPAHHGLMCERPSRREVLFYKEFNVLLKWLCGMEQWLATWHGKLHPGKTNCLGPSEHLCSGKHGGAS